MPDSTSRSARLAGDSSAPPQWLRSPWPEDLYPARRPLLLVLSGPSGVGKDAVIRALKAEGYPLHYAITVTSRPRRRKTAEQEEEIDGVHYFFATPEEFAQLRDSGQLLEWANVSGYEYGTPKGQVRRALQSGRDVLLKIDVQGAAKVRQSVPGAILIYLGPASRDELVARLKRRGTEQAEHLKRKLEAIDAELRAVGGFDYVVVNREGQLAEAVAQVKSIIEAERLRRCPRECDLG